MPELTSSGDQPHELLDMKSISIRRTQARHLTLLVLLLTAGVVHGSLWAISDDRELWGDEKMYWQGARELQTGHDWHPPPLWPPLYPRFLSALLAADGSTTLVRLVQTLMLAGIALLWRDLTHHWSGSRFAGNIACGLTLAYPPLAAFAHFLWPEVLHLLAFSSALWILVRRSQKALWLAVAGCLLGTCLLTKSLLGPLIPVLLLPLCSKAAGPLMLRGLRVLLVLTAMAGTLAPTAISNHQRGTGVILANSAAFNIWVGLNERSRKSFVDPVAYSIWCEYTLSADTYPERDAALWTKIHRKLRDEGALSVLKRQLKRQYFRLFDRDSFLTDMLPGGAITHRGGGFRNPPETVAAALRTLSYGLYAAILVGTAFGIAVCPPRGRPWLKIVLLFLAYHLALFLILHAKSRFRVPLLPICFFYSSCSATWLLYRVKPLCRSQLIAAITTAWLVLFFAFGGSLAGSPAEERGTPDHPIDKTKPSDQHYDKRSNTLEKTGTSAMP